MSKANRAGYASWALGLALCGGSACRGSDTSSIRPGGADPSDGAGPAEYQVSTKNDVQWKRHAALEADLSRALELDPAALCSELGQANCIRQVHLVPLGGNDPFDTGILQPSAEPLATTPAIIDRVLLSACGQRAALDRDAPQGQAVVFKALDMNGAMPDPGDARVSATITELYQRLLARNPTADELATVAELARDADQRPLAAFDFARLSCFAIGGSTENLFY